MGHTRGQGQGVVAEPRPMAGECRQRDRGDGEDEPQGGDAQRAREEAADRDDGGEDGHQGEGARERDLPRIRRGDVGAHGAVEGDPEDLGEGEEHLQ